MILKSGNQFSEQIRLISMRGPSIPSAECSLILSRKLRTGPRACAASPLRRLQM
jgi:hypothetical protein